MIQFKNSTILVIGGTGFIGTNFVKKVLNYGAKVTCLSLTKNKNKINHKNLKYIICD